MWGQPNSAVHSIELDRFLITNVKLAHNWLSATPVLEALTPLRFV